MARTKKVKKLSKVEPVEESTESSIEASTETSPTETDSDVMIRIPFGESFVGSDVLRLHNEHYVDKLYDSARDVIDGFVKNGNVLGDVIVLTTTLMEGVKVYKGLTGSEKKIIVLKVVRKVLSEVTMPENTHAALIGLVNLVLPAAIDVIVSAANGKYEFKKTCGCGV